MINPLVAGRMIFKFLHPTSALVSSTDQFLACLNDLRGSLYSFHEIKVMRCIESCGV